VPTRSLAAGLALALPLLAAAAPPELAADIPANTSTRAQARVGVNYTPGVLERSGDRDWFRVKLTEGQGYIIKAERNSAPPDPPWDLETVLRDPSAYPQEPLCEDGMSYICSGCTHPSSFAS
jgi:hypothetical protein